MSPSTCLWKTFLPLLLFPSRRKHLAFERMVRSRDMLSRYICSELTHIGKNWHSVKKAFRPTAGQTTYEKRKLLDGERRVTKAREQEMREEKEEERNRRIQIMKDRRKAKEEKERYEKMAEKMHAKLVERRKRREKRNKLLKS